MVTDEVECSKTLHCVKTLAATGDRDLPALRADQEVMARFRGQERNMLVRAYVPPLIRSDNDRNIKKAFSV